MKLQASGIGIAAVTLAGCLLAAAAARGAEEYNPYAGRDAAPADTGRLIVKLRTAPSAGGAAKPAAAAARVAELGRRTGLGVRHLRELGAGMEVVELEDRAAAADGGAALARLRADPEVVFAEPDARMRPHRVPNDPGFFEQWFLQAPAPTPSGLTASAVDAVAAWDVTLGSPAVVVAVIDTGVRFDHPDLGRVADGGRLLPGYDFVSPDSNGTARTANDGDGWDPDPSDPGDWISALDRTTSTFAGCPLDDSSWHGTRVSGIVAGLTDNALGIAGVAWNGRLLPVRVLGKCGGLTSDVIAGMRWAAGLTQSGAPANPTPARILNLSLGGQGACSSAYQSAIDEITARGVLVVASAGNDGSLADQPGNCRGVVSVTAVRHAGTKVGFANLGTDVTLAAPGGNCVNVGPGDACLFSLDTTTNLGLTIPGANGYTGRVTNYNVGTSFAAPIVSGVAALMASVNGNLAPARLAQRLQLAAAPFPISADPNVPTCRVPSSSDDPQLAECNCTTQTCGAGMVNAPGAVAQALRPVAVVSSPGTAAAGSTVTLSGAGSRAADDRTISGYEWTVVSGGAALSALSGPTTTFVAPAAGGTVVVRLSVADDLGRTDVADATVIVSGAPPPPPPPPPPTGGGGDGGGGGGGSLDALVLLLGALLAWPARRSRLRRAGRGGRALAVLAALLLPALAGAETLRYVVQMEAGNVAGHQVVTRRADGLTTVDFSFKDNGRGPEIVEEYRLAPDGTYASYRARGKTTFGAPVDEKFERSGAAARWNSTSDRGELEVAGAALYAPLAGTPDATSVALAALAQRADARLPLIPGGTLGARKVADATLTRDGQRRDLQLVMITGLGLTPQFAWATTGPSPRLFALIVPGWLRVVEEGWQDEATALAQRQVEAEAAALVALGQRVAHRLDGLTLIRNARVFDSETATLGGPSDVYAFRGRITRVVPASSADLAADHVVDAGGRVLLPGLIDMHTHVSRWDGGLHLAAGVTTVRDLGNDNATVQAMISGEADGTLLMPRIVPAGYIEGASPFASTGGFVVEDLAGAKAAIDWYAQRGYPQVKIYNSFPKDALRETVAYAHAQGLRVSGHVPAFLRAQDVVDMGFDEIQHVNQVLLNFFVTPKTDTRTLERFYLVADRAADLDLDSKPVQDFVALLAAKQVVVDPTLVAFDFLRQRAGQLAPAYAAVASHLPPDLQRSMRVAEMDIPDDRKAARYERSYAKCIEFVGRLYRAGVPIVAGTDELPGFAYQRELELYVQAGLTPAQALQVATWTGAKYARVLGDRGSIAPGKAADLVLVDGDPTRDIGAIRRVALVVKGESAYYPSELYAELGVQPFAEPLRFSGPAAGGT